MMKKSLLKKVLLIIPMGIVLGAFSCHDNEAPLAPLLSTISTGVFIDAPVKGLEYSTATQSGVTNELGEYQYKAGEKVNFSIGGLSIGEVDVASEIPVTALERYIEVARLLQSLDTDVREDLIDISGIQIPAGLRDQLDDLLSNGQSSFDAVMTQAALDSIESESQLQLVNDSPVTEQAAAEHISGSISENFTVNDFNRQTYVTLGGGDVVVTSFEDDGTGLEFYNEGDTSPYKKPFTWSVTDGKLASYQAGEMSTISLLSVDDNRYSIFIVNSEEKFIADTYKAKTFNVAALDGKILSLDTINDTECTARTLKVTGETGVFKEHCTGGYYEVPVTFSNASSLDNTVYMRGTNRDGDAFSVKINLIQGDLDSSGKFSTIGDPEDAAPKNVEIQSFNITNTEVENTNSDSLLWTPEMTNNKTYYLAGSCSRGPTIGKVTFNASGEGTYEEVVGSSSGGDFNHSITSDGYLHIVNPDEDFNLVIIEKLDEYMLFEYSGDQSRDRLYYSLASATAFANSEEVTDLSICEEDSDVYVSGNNITSGTINFTNGQTPSQAYVRVVPESFQDDDSSDSTYSYGDSLRCKVQSDGTWGLSDCIISASGKAGFQSSNSFEFEVFIDTNNDTRYNPEESYVCGASPISWEDWKPTFACNN